VYEHSLSLTLFVLFFAFLVPHVTDATKELSAEGDEHEDLAVPIPPSLTSSQCSFEVLQDWREKLRRRGLGFVLRFPLRAQLPGAEAN
jgi:hypothetical protein